MQIRDFKNNTVNNSGVTLREARDTQISIAKGLAIIFMVIGHSGVSRTAVGFLCKFIYAFHMPLFFFVAGYCFKSSSLGSFPKYTKRKLSGIYWPYVKWGIVFMLLHNIFIDANVLEPPYYDYEGYRLKLKGILEFLEGDRLLGGYWFLTALFAASMCSWLILKVCGLKPSTLAKVIVFIVVTIIIGNRILPEGIKNFKSILGPTQILLYSTFFLCGALTRSCKTIIATYLRNNLTGFASNIHWFVAVASLLIVVIVVCITGKVEIKDNFLTWTMPIYLIGALAGIVFTLSVSSQLRNSRVAPFLIYAGDHTLGILTWHFLAFKLVTMLIIAIEGYDITMLSTFPCIQGVAWWHWIAYTIVGVIVPLAFDRLLSYTKVYFKTTLYRATRRLRPSA